MSSPSGPHIEGMTWLELLGSGGYSDVHLYQRTSPRMKVAVKILKDDRLTDAERAQFAAEAETMAELADHPYIVQVFSTGALEDGRPYLVMKQYPPRNLAVRAAQERIPLADVLRNGVKIASAVETAHRAGIMHRDIKPANVLVSQYGEPGLTDFGIAGHAEHDDGDDIGVSIPWAAPEVLTGASNGTVQSDVYSLGATVWHLLAGRSPFDVAGDNSQRALVSRVVRSAVPQTGRADAPQSLERLLAQAMAKNPAVRPRSALEFARGLQAIEQEQRLDRTDIVVEGLGAARDSSTDWARPTTGENATRMKAPVRVMAEPPSQGSRSAFAPPMPGRAAPGSTTPTGGRSVDAGARGASGPSRGPVDAVAQTFVDPVGPARERQSAPGVKGESTVRRPVTPETAEPDLAPSRRRGVRRAVVGMIAAAAVVATVAIGIVLSSSGAGDKPRSDRSPDVVASQNEQQSVMPNPPIVSATTDQLAHVVRFSWHAVGAPSGASFGYYVNDQDATDPTPTTATTLALPATSDPSHVCLNVVVIVAFSPHSLPGQACGS